MMSTIAAVLMTILALFAVCNAMLENLKQEKSVKFYKVKPEHFRNVMPYLTAEPKHIPKLDAATVLSLSEIKPPVSTDAPSSDQSNSSMINSGDSSWSNTNTQTSNYSTQNFLNTLNKRKSSPKSASKSASKKKACSSTTSHDFNQSQSAQFHPNQNQSLMQFHPIQDQSSMQFHPIQDQSSMQFHPNQNQSSMQFHPIQDQSSMQFHPIQESSSWYNDNSDPNEGLLGSITKFLG